jgi:hypothetical protein
MEAPPVALKGHIEVQQGVCCYSNDLNRGPPMDGLNHMEIVSVHGL